MEERKESFEEWKAGFEGLTFEQTATRMRDKILESPELDSDSRKYFTDLFDYVMKQHLAGRPLDTNLMKIHMTEIKNHGDIKLEQFGRALLLLSLCGFQFDFSGKVS